MTRQKKSTEQDPTTYNAYGDPINNTPLTINDQHSSIAERTQNGSSGNNNQDTKKRDTTAYGDPVIEDAASNPDHYKLATSPIATSTQEKNTDLHT